MLDAGYDDGDLINTAAQRYLAILAPLSNALGESIAQARRDRAVYLATPAGKTRYALRGTSIEPFFGTIKEFFGLDPLPRPGKCNAATFILLALYTWNLIVLFNFLNNRPLGADKSLLDSL